MANEKKEVKAPKKRANFGKFIDGSVYWFALIVLSVLAVAGVRFYLQPVDNILSSVFAVSFVGAFFYIALRNRQYNGEAKQGNSLRKSNVKRVAQALLLAALGLIVYYYAYGYTHQAKLEDELNTTQYQYEQLQLEKTNLIEDKTLKEKELKEKIKQLEADLQAKKAEKVRLANLEQKKAQASSVSVTGTKADWLAASKINPSDYGFVDYIISKESSWRPDARNASSGAGGLPQALPYSKTGCGWADAVCQLNWADNYAKSRYGSWAKAHSFWLQNSWWQAIIKEP